jgi:hypothetical protein
VDWDSAVCIFRIFWWPSFRLSWGILATNNDVILSTSAILHPITSVKLNEKNYIYWALVVEIHLCGRGLFHHLEKEKPKLDDLIHREQEHNQIMSPMLESNEPSVVCNPQQNEVVESKNLQLLDITRALMIHMHIPRCF